jgi:cation diffusion facilitator CzcD-associated flavoprotein CzcO
MASAVAFADTARAAPRATARVAARQDCNVAVIGAGPYGLAVAAHLKAAGVETLVVGEPMGFWRNNMPSGMRVRSPWRATHIADPADELSLDAYARLVGMTPSPQLPIAEFLRYGTWFQTRAVPDLDTRKVAMVHRAANRFRLVLEDGCVVDARRVVVAMGLANQSFRPTPFHGLPSHLVSHSSEHVDLARFRGRRVAVIGRGQSACESAVLLAEAGAEVELISRGGVLWIGSPQRKGNLALRVRKALISKSEVGPFPLDWLADAPGLTRLFPDDLRSRFTTRCLRPAASAWLRPRSETIRFTPGHVVASVQPTGDRLRLRLDDSTIRTVDHVLLGTGYRIDITRFGVLSPDIVAAIRLVDGSPRLSAGFESSVRGLHFVGSSAVNSFGPLMRFIAGCGHAARGVTRSALARH